MTVYLSENSCGLLLLTSQRTVHVITQNRLKVASEVYSVKYAVSERVETGQDRMGRVETRRDRMGRDGLGPLSPRVSTTMEQLFGLVFRLFAGLVLTDCSSKGDQCGLRVNNEFSSVNCDGVVYIVRQRLNLN